MEEFLVNPINVSLASMQAFLLVFFRVTGLFERLPMIGGMLVPRVIRVWFAFFVAVVIFPVVLKNQPIPFMPQSIGIFLIAVVAEFGLGLMLGLASSLLLTGIQLGGRMLDDQMSFSLANVIDPVNNEQVSITSQGMFVLGTLIFIVMGGVNLLIWLLGQSFLIVPLIGFHMSEDFMMWMLTELFPQSLILGVVFAAPSIIVGMLATLALGLVGRVVPEMNIFSFSFGVRVFLGLAMLVLSVKYMPGLMGFVLEGTAFHMTQLIHYARGT